MCAHNAPAWIIANEEDASMDHLQAIRIFARVVETGSFKQASRSLVSLGQHQEYRTVAQSR